LGTPAVATPTRAVDLGSTEGVLRWINAYRAKPDLARVPLAVRTLSRLDALRDAEGSSVYLGFVAGIIGSNPQKADELVEKMLAIKTEDQWFIVRAIAYSGMTGWRDLLRRYADRMPTRTLMIEKYISGKTPTLENISFEKSPSTMDKFKGIFVINKPQDTRLEATSDILDTLWGYYFATASYGPVGRILHMLPWTKERDSAEKLTVGSMAKYTLASNAAHDPDLLAMLKREEKHEPAEVRPALHEIIEAVDTMEIAHLRKEALAAIDDLKRKGPGSKRDLSTWGQVGQGAIALGCVAAAAAGQLELGIPCVVGGALSSATLNYWTKD
jgi:hypothetical protein